MDLNHTYDAPCKDNKKCCYTSKLVKSVIFQDVQGQLLLKSKDIRREFKYDYGIELSYYYAYSRKKMAMKYTHTHTHMVMTRYLTITYILT